MGLIGNLVGTPGSVKGIGSAVQGVAEVFVPNATKKMVMSHEAYRAALAQYGLEFQGPRVGWFDRFVNALNRLPRPALAIGTLGLFVYAMMAPDDFAVRMQGLAYVPEPLWWLLGAVVSFYFGARELHHGRVRRTGTAAVLPEIVPPTKPASDNAALRAWQQGRGR